MKLMEAFKYSKVEWNFNQEQRLKSYGVFERQKQIVLE